MPHIRRDGASARVQPIIRSVATGTPTPHRTPPEEQDHRFPNLLWCACSSFLTGIADKHAPLHVDNRTALTSAETECHTTNEFKSFFKSVDGNEGGKCKYPHRLDTYGRGCRHDCKYCYAKSLLDFRDLWDPNNPAVADIAKIERCVKRIAKDGEIKTVRMGGMTDCFQPDERKYGVTYETIKLLNQYGIHYLIVTKSDMVAEDKYMAVMDKNLAHIQITVTTTDDELSTTYEKAPAPSKRIAAIEKLQAAGYDVALRLSSFIEQYIDFDILNKVKCDKILVEFLRANTWIRKWFDIDYSDYTISQHGYNHLPLDKKIKMLSRVTGFKELTVCEDEDEAYEYWKANVNPNKEDCCNLRF